MTDDMAEGLPQAGTPAEVLGTMHFVLNSLGRELGERYDAHLKATIGPNWAPALANIRHVKHINKYDPHFVLAEPLKFPDSPTRACLPSGGVFFNKLEDALDVRNAWSHHEVAPLDLANLKASIATVHVFADAAGMRLGTLCSAIKKRINAIANGAYPPEGSTSTSAPQIDIDALLTDLAHARAQEESLQADVAAAQALLDDAAGADAANAELAGQLSAIRMRLDEALADKEKLEFVIEALASAETAETTEPLQGDWVQATPGHKWHAEIPARRVTMMSLHPDLFDETTRERVAGEFGSQATTIIAAWKATVAPNASIFLSPAGQAVTYISGTPIYLGSLREAGGSSREVTEAVGFFIPHTYTLRLNGTIEDRDTGETLADANPDAAAEVAGRLLAAAPAAGRLRVTTAGKVAKNFNGEWRAVSKIAASEWFPGHLAVAVVEQPPAIVDDLALALKQSDG